MTQIPLPLTKDSYDTLYGTWLSFAETPESGSCYYHNKSDLLYRIHQLQTDSRLKNCLKNVSLQVIDAEALNIENPEGLHDALEGVSPHRKNTLIFIIGIDHFLTRGDRWFFNFLMKKEIELKTVGFLLCFTIDFLHPQYRTVFDSASTWIGRTVRFPLHSEEDTLSYLNHQATVWHMKYTHSQIQFISKQTTGGYFLLPKEALRYLRDNPKTKEYEIIHHKEMQLRVEALWRQLLPSEQSVMKKVLQHISITDSIELHSLEFLTDTGWINKIHGKYEIAIPLLADYIQSEKTPVSFAMTSSGRMTLNAVPIDGQLSKTEQRLLAILINSKGKTVSRDSIAEVIANGNEDYNDWAIDKAMSRLRKKLASLDVPPSVIKTIHGKGFVLSNNI